MLPVLGGQPPPGATSCAAGGARSFAGAQSAPHTEERMTAPLAPLYFSPKMDCSLQLQFRGLMRERRDAFMLHLKDSLPDSPLIILVVTNRSYQRDTNKKDPSPRRQSRAFRRREGVPQTRHHLSKSRSSHATPLHPRQAIELEEARGQCELQCLVCRWQIAITA